MAYADTFYELINFRTVEDGDDDQLFYTHAFLDEKTRKQFGIYLDSQADIFMNLNGAAEEIEIDFSREEFGINKVVNTKVRSKHSSTSYENFCFNRFIVILENS